MHTLDAKIPPPVILLFLGVLASAAAFYIPAFTFDLPYSELFAGALALAGLGLNIYPKFTFNQVGTTVNPLKPDSTVHLVTSGVYRYTRNPMYLGHSMILLGWSLYLQSMIAILVVPVFIIFVSRFQIRPEERYLSTRFPDDYAAFCKRVPRWL
ncbi:isoprenylcysteine carboxylmethyltransferase family protein [Luteimonas sp. 3794]|uniref:methyltransferase family protein n=1 Tax=Luteimonas sp. 3794 TaxID=2817730 RepID=UPI002863AEFA|nr:isoprenylcysteine carboxylmethyltransferase family protein [Luteimonas sp. 3794]MDR6990169.1 protein-S-isoprenylcysteine O-methyltransferase Ste14 [Luteimonas sp. 3794]